MKPRSIQFFPRTLVVCVAPLLACVSAQAALINFNEISTTNVWTFPTGTNVLATATVTPGTPATHEGSSGSWATLTDGALGAAAGNDPAQSVTPNNNDTVTYALDVVAQPAGYNITSFDSYCAWANSGRDNQNYTIQYSTVGAPGTFINLATVNNGTGEPNKATHTSLTDTTGFLAMGVHSVRITFAGQENGYTGFREMILRAQPATINTVNESNNTNVWTFPAGINLLNGNTANSPSGPANANHGNGDITSSSWSVLTNGTLGLAGNQLESAAPLNNTSVILPLDISVNFNGYNISSFDSYCAWPNSGRDNQDFAIRYSTVAAPTVFIPLAAVDNNTGGDNSTHTRLTSSSGVLASGVAAIQIYFNNQENGYVGYREFIALGTAVPLADPLTWTGGSGTAGNADWIAGPDNNWKQTIGGAPDVFDPLAELTFDITGANRNINIPTALTGSSLTFANDNITPYTVGGQLLTVSNSIASSGTGSATFNNSVSAATGVTLSGAGSLVFNSDLQSPGLTLSGTGGIILNAANPALTGNIAVSSGTLTVANDGALEFGALVMTGGTTDFTSSSPVVASLAGTAGTVNLGKSVGAVNTNLFVGNAFAVTTSFAGNIGNASGTVGSLTKVGASSLILSGTNTYSGPTDVQSGSLEFGQSLSLPTTSRSAATLVVSSATVGFKVGSVGEFTETDLTNISLGGFDSGSTLGINTTADFTLSKDLTQPGMGLLKSGPAILSLTGNNTADGLIRIIAGTINAASPSAQSLGGSVQMGNASANVVLNMGAGNQFGANSVVSMTAAPFYQARMHLKGTSQTIAGLDASTSQNISIVQNDESGQPGYVSPPGPASLTINAATDHSFYGIIRNGDGGAVSLIKNGPGTQEFRNQTIQGYLYNGSTTINEGTLKLNFDSARPTDWNSNINIAASGATLELAGGWNIFRTISGPGKLVKSSPGQISVCNVDGDANANTYTGGTVINEGTLKFYATNGSTGEGNVPGEFCVAGPMNPSNVIQVKGGATLGVGAIACFGESPLLPQYGVTINIEPGGRLWGADGNNIAFVPNVTLDGATVEVTDGSGVGGFNTNMTLVGTVVVGGTSNVASQIFNSPGITGPNANISLGSAGLPGTVFQVANVTGSSAVDFLVYSPLRNVGSAASPLTKAGPGTMFLIGAKSYTGETRVEQGELRLDTECLADTARVSIDSGAFLNLLFAEEDTVKTLKLDGVQVAAGTYGSTTNTTPGIIQTPRIKGDGLLLVTTDPAVSYATWSLQIPGVNDRDRTDDPDGDGFTNLQEFLFGTSPTTGNGSLSTIEDTGSGLIVRWNEREDSDSVYILQESTTLENPWPTSGAAITNNATQDIPDYVRKQALVPVDSARKFVRVFATE